uniref:Uncharacterized protein n=1 Tax=Anguilla anguilla TaxID=7936 RepID=A0A0E9TS06_ANGAN
MEVNSHSCVPHSSIKAFPEEWRLF